jgi:hypothetical protein
MTIAVWRASGVTFDVDGYMRRFSALAPDAVWRKGDVGVGGRVSADSGFNKTLFEATSPDLVSVQIVKALQEWRDAAEALVAQGVGSMLDLGIVVGGPHAFTGSVFLDVNALQLLATLKIGLTVSAYPSTDEANHVPL